jgi:phospholipase C
MYVISPWSRGGWVNSQAFDHTSVMRFLEARFGVKEPNIPPFRRAVCGDLTSAFNFATPNSEALPPLAGRKTQGRSRQAARWTSRRCRQVPLPLDPQLPRQATGTRPSRALPYELHTSARADAIGGKVQLLFANTGKAAAVFHVYDKLNLDRLPRRYMVEPGKTLDDVERDDRQQRLLRPVGARAERLSPPLQGRPQPLRAGDAAVPEVRVCYDIANGNVYLSMRNDGKNRLPVHRAGEGLPRRRPVDCNGERRRHHRRALGARASGQWYDFAVTCDADAGLLPPLRGPRGNRQAHGERSGDGVARSLSLCGRQCLRAPIHGARTTRCAGVITR